MEEITLEKIDTIRKRTNLTYSEAKTALENNNGNVVDTLIHLESNKSSFSSNISDFSSDLLDSVKDIIKKGNVNRIKIKRDNKTLIDIPVNAGIAAGAASLFAPSIIAVSAVTAIAAKVTIEIERPDGSVEVVNDMIKNTLDSTIEKAKDIADDLNSKKDTLINKDNYGTPFENKDSENDYITIQEQNTDDNK